MKILNFGSCNIDSVYGIDRIVLPGETIAAKSLAFFPGGKGLNQSIALARAGAEVYFAGCIGADGDLLINEMGSAGISLLYLKTVSEKTGHAIIQVDSSGENCIIIYPGANHCITKEQIDAVLQNFEKGDILLTQNEICNVDYLIHRAYAMGMTVVFNPSPYHQSLRELDLKDIHWLILNETEAVGLFESGEPEKIQAVICRSYPQLKAVLTLGKRGSVYIDKDCTYHQDAYQMETVDTTAAGDTYTGYFIAEMSARGNIKEAMDLASAASALAVAQNGAASSIPTRQDVMQKRKSLPHYLSDKTDDRKAAALRFFDEHYSDGTIQTLSRVLGYSSSYTSVWLKENLGAAFTALIQKKRIQVGAELLKSTQLPVTEIINRVGYRNETQFRAVFRQEFDCTPLKFRQNQKG